MKNALLAVLLFALVLGFFWIDSYPVADNVTDTSMDSFVERNLISKIKIQEDSTTIKLSHDINEATNTSIQDDAQMADFILNMEPELMTAMEQNIPLIDVLAPDDYEKLKNYVMKNDRKFIEHNILAELPELKKMRLENLRAMSTEENMADYRTKLSDSQVIQTTLDSISIDEDSREFNVEDEVNRMMHVDFYKDMIEDTSLLQDDSHRQKLASYILDDNIFDSSFEHRLRQSYYVDRIEIFKSVVKSSPQLAQSLLTQIKPSKYKEHLSEVYDYFLEDTPNES